MGHRLTALGRLTAVALAAGCAVGLWDGTAGAHTAPPVATWSQAQAPDGPGATSYLSLGRKDCLGSAMSNRSRVWFTVAGGVLSDVYSPTSDNTNLDTLQYLVTDGHTFTDLQTRDMTYTVQPLDRTGMSCQVTATADSRAYRIVTDYLTDPRRDSVVMHTTYVPLTSAARAYHLYVRYDATINGAGGGGSTNGGANSATIVPATGGGAEALVSDSTLGKSSTPQRNYEVPLYGALASDRAFPESSSGFVGEPSDGLTQLDEHHVLGPTYQQATDGNVEQTAEIDVSHRRSFTLALGYGQTQASAVQTAAASAATPFARTEARYAAGWERYDAGLHPPARGFPGLTAAQDQAVQRQYWIAANVLKATEDKEFPGAIVSSLADPWGQATAANTETNGLPNVSTNYRVIFERDFYETFTGFLTDGDLQTARAQTRFIFDRVQLPDGSFPRDALLGGATASDNYVLEPDEQAFPLIMAWQAGLGHDRALYLDHVRPAAEFLVAHGPVYGDERWEDQSGYSPSNIATEIAGLVSAARIARMNHDAAHAQLFLATADAWRRHVLDWTVTTNGPYSPDPYFLRLSKTGDPNAATVYNLGNGSINADQRTVIDAGFLELTRFGELPAGSALVRNSLAVVDRVLASSTPSGVGFHRYGTLLESVNGQNVPVSGSTDGYGDCYAPAPMHCPLTGRPWIPWFTGTGHVWPLLNGERGEHDLQVGDPGGASTMLDEMANFADGVGMIPEQDWEDPDVPASPYGTDPTTASIGFVDGKGTGSAGEITWAEAQFVRLARDIASGRVLEQPRIVAARYLPGVPAGLPLTASVAQASAGSRVTITGRTRPGAHVVAAATLSPAGATDPGGTAHSKPIPTVTGSTIARHASFRLTLTLTPGTWVVTETAMHGDRRTAERQQTVVVSAS